VGTSCGARGPFTNLEPQPQDLDPFRLLDAGPRRERPVDNLANEPIRFLANFAERPRPHGPPPIHDCKIAALLAEDPYEERSHGGERPGPEYMAERERTRNAPRSRCTITPTPTSSCAIQSGTRERSERGGPALQHAQDRETVTRSVGRRGTVSDRSATGVALEKRLGMSLERVIPGSLYRVAWRERLRHSGRVDPLSGNRENPHTDYQVDLVIVRGVEFQPGDTAEEVPLVAIEAKTTATTDNIIAAAKKADDIRAVYPWLRFGFVENDPYLTEKSLWHGRAFDFISMRGESPRFRTGHAPRRNDPS
jgi:hypothetical protein